MAKKLVEEEDTGMRDRTRTPLIVLAAVVFAAVLGGALYGAFAEPDTYDPTTPEGVVQTYLKAVFDGDELASLNSMTADLADRCQDATSLEYGTDGARAFLDKTTIDNDTATVAIEIRHSSDGIDEWIENETIWLEKSADSWQISQPPWPYWDCVKEQ
jgi:hypothetical protein